MWTIVRFQATRRVLDIQMNKRPCMDQIEFWPEGKPNAFEGRGRRSQNDLGKAFIDKWNEIALFCVCSVVLFICLS